MLTEGTNAPDFHGVDQQGRTIGLSDLKGKWVALYFYPKDDTPGCTAEACAFRDNMESLTALGLEVVGVSTQDAESHDQFAKKHHLSFRLIADPDKKITTAFDSVGMFGMAKRVTFLLDPAGVIRDVYQSGTRPTSHVAHVQEAFGRLKAK